MAEVPSRAVGSAGAGRTALRIGIVALVVGAYGYGRWWYGDRHHSFDLRIYYHAVNWWASGHDLYSYGQPDPIQGVLRFTYPPFAALVMFPMAWMSLSATVTAFWVINCAAIVITTWWLAEPIAIRHGWPRWYVLGIAVPAVLGLSPIWETVTLGQINFLLVLLAFGDLLFLVPKRSRWAGVGVGVATAIKLTPGIFIIYLLVTRRFRAALTSIGAVVAASALALVYRPHDSWQFFTSTVWDAARVGHLDRVANQSLLGMLSRLATPGQASRPLWALLVLLAAGYAMWRAVRAARAGDELAGVTLASLAGALASPVTWDHHLYWFVPALLIIVDAVATGVRRRWWYAAFTAIAIATLTFGLIDVYDYRWVSLRDVNTPGGFVLANWYLLLVLALVVLLPVRSLPPGEPPAALTLGPVTRSRAGRQPAGTQSAGGPVSGGPSSGSVQPAGGGPAGGGPAAEPDQPHGLTSARPARGSRPDSAG